jgi:c(7)-type cytochrome triheme protein
VTARAVRDRFLALAGRITPWGAVAAALIALGIASAEQRFRLGLGATTHLSDRFPWGFWIGFDFLGIGIAAAGFTIVATVHLLHIERFEPIVRPALLTAFLGYLLVVVILVVDLGRWDRFWHPLVMWNPHSVMFEITWCVILYTTVLLLEFSPIVLERFRVRAPLPILRSISLPVMIAGVILSTLHQSSFGSLYLAVPGRLHPLWYTPLLPLLFLVSCLAAGISMVLFECHLLARWTGFRLAPDLRDDLGKAVAVILAIFGTVRIQDLLARRAFRFALEPSYHAVLFWTEFLLGVALPVALLLIPRVRVSAGGSFACSLMSLAGFAANRMNTVVTGLESWPGQTYVPSLQEMFIGLGTAAAGFVAFVAAASALDLVPGLDRSTDRPAAPELVRRGFFLGGAAAAAVLVGLGLMAGRRSPGPSGFAEAAERTATTTSVEPDVTKAMPGFRMPPDVRIPGSSESPGQVTFKHSSHVDASRPECVTCHQGRFPMLGPTPAAGPDGWHGKTRCGSCHDGQQARDVGADCDTCHVDRPAP